MINVCLIVKKAGSFLSINLECAMATCYTVIGLYVYSSLLQLIIARKSNLSQEGVVSCKLPSFGNDLREYCHES